MINNYFRSLRKFNVRRPRLHFLFLLIFGFFAAFTGFYADIFHLSFERSILSPGYFLILFIFPSFLEESFFRGILIPIDTLKRGRSSVIQYTIFSSLIFALWHPFNAFMFNPDAKNLFYNLFFLIIVFVLGIFCSLSYIFSRSLWPAVFIHWIVVVIWVGFLGGRNLILENLPL